MQALTSRLPFLFLAVGSFSCLYYINKASEQLPAAGLDTGGFAHSVGLFFYPGVASSSCASFWLKKTYFLLHLVLIVHSHFSGFSLIWSGLDLSRSKWRCSSAFFALPIEAPGRCPDAFSTLCGLILLLAWLYDISVFCCMLQSKTYHSGFISIVPCEKNRHQFNLP